ncbi:MAG: glycosyltransferase [Betaproteobacteria bacterium]|nr:glycosyltransferase [Betaproteobacteria bacterium]
MSAREHMPKRIGLLLDSLVGGGAERIALNFADAFRALGHDVHVFIVRNEVAHETNGHRIHALSETGALARSRPLNKWLLAKRIRRLVADIESDGKPFDFFISNAEDMDRISGMARLPHVFIRYRNSMMHFLGAKIGRATGLKRIVRRYRWRQKFRRIYGGRHIVAITEAMRQELLHEMGIVPASLTVIYNPFDFEKLRTLASEPARVPEAPYIVYSARIGVRKDQELLIRAWREADVPHGLVLLGGTTDEKEEAYLQHLKSLVKDLGVEGRVLFAGFQKNPYPWVKHAALFAMSSRSEGLPTVLIESLILGTPVVSTDCPTGPGEILTGEFARFLSPVGNVAALARNIRAALDSYPPITDEILAKFHRDYAIGRYLALAEALRRP